MKDSISPLVIDNTNIELWEMKQYVINGLSYGYDIEIKTPSNDWSWDVQSCFEKNSHGVPYATVEKMKKRYQPSYSIDEILTSKDIKTSNQLSNDFDRADNEQFKSKTKTDDGYTSIEQNIDFLSKSFPEHDRNYLKAIFIGHSKDIIKTMDVLNLEVEENLSNTNLTPFENEWKIDDKKDSEPPPMEEFYLKLDKQLAFSLIESLEPNNIELQSDLLEMDEIEITIDKKFHLELVNKIKETIKFYKEIPNLVDEYERYKVSKNLNECGTLGIEDVNEAYRLHYSDDTCESTINNIKNEGDYQTSLLSLQLNEQKSSSKEYINQQNVENNITRWSDIIKEPIIRTKEELNGEKLIPLSNDYETLRYEARHRQSLKKEYNQKAAVAFAKKQFELAAFYAQQSRYHATKMKESHSKAGQVLFEQRCEDLKVSGLLDLHWMHQNEALETVEKIIDNKEDYFYKRSYFDVITGRGVHSRQQKAKLKPLIIHLLKKKKQQFKEINDGLIRVFL